jgi:hypothetical protein
VSLPSATDFETVNPVTFEDFEGKGTVDQLELAGGLTVSVGYAHFLNVDHFVRGYFDAGWVAGGGTGIQIGSINVGGVGVSAVLVGGTWKLFPEF